MKHHPKPRHRLKIALALVFCLYYVVIGHSQSFEKEQKRYKRVRIAYQEKEAKLQEALKKIGINNFDINVLLRVIKSEKTLELWVCPRDSNNFQLLRSYRVCAASGVAGPKRQFGDMQVPEGFYYIDRFNPTSNFFLSLGIDYPNRSDHALGVKGNLGGNIFIHGACASIGCVSITDPLIKEVYLLAVKAKNGGQEKIPVLIFPSRMRGNQYSQLINGHSDQPQLLSFWENIKVGYDHFEDTHRPPTFMVNKLGKYVFGD